MSKNKAVGYIRNQTVQCDYIVCSKTCSVEDYISVGTLKANFIENPQFNALIEKVQKLEDKLNILERGQEALTTPFTQGEVVSTTLHFDDVDLSDPTFNIDAFNNELTEKIAFQAGVQPYQIVIVDLAQTGSVTARVDVIYEKTNDRIRYIPSIFYIRQ